MTVTANPSRIYQQAHGFAKGQPVYINPADGKYALACADTEVRARVVGVVNTYLTTDYFTLAGPRDELLDLPLRVIGAVYYLHPTTPGAVTPTQPSLFVREIYQATTTDRAKILLNYIAGDSSGDDDAEAIADALAAHIAQATNAHAASAIANNPAGTIGSFTVQNAINELDTDIQDHIADTVDAHDATAISFVSGGSLTSTEVNAAIDELEALITAPNFDAIVVDIDSPLGEVVVDNDTGTVVYAA